MLCFTGSAQWRKQHWFLPPINLDMVHGTATTSPVPYTTGTNYSNADAVYVDNGNAIVYVYTEAFSSYDGRRVYDANGNHVFDLPGFTSSGFICNYNPSLIYLDSRHPTGAMLIVPRPATCNEWFVIYSVQSGPPGGSALVYSSEAI